MSTNYNFKQITNYDLKDYPRKDGYITILEDKNVKSFSYSCEPKGVNYPIKVLNENDIEYNTINIPKSCMLEVHSEVWTSVVPVYGQEQDEDDKKSKKIIGYETLDPVDYIPTFVGFKIPDDIEFTLEYLVE